MMDALQQESLGSQYIGDPNRKLRVFKLYSYLILCSDLKEVSRVDPANHKDFFDELANRIGILQPSDWYKLRKEDIYAHGGKKLLQRFYHNSLYKVGNRICA